MEPKVRMNPQKTRATIEHVIYELFGRGDLSRYDELVCEDVKVHYPLSWLDVYPAFLHGKEKVEIVDRNIVELFRSIASR